MRVMIQGQDTFIYTAGKDIDQKLPSIVFIHGAANDHSVWILQSRWFAHHTHNTLAPDLPGHGLSAGAPLNSIEALANWLLDLLKSLGLTKASLCGHSMGSLIALEAATQAPDSIKKLALLGCSIPMAVSDNLLDAAKEKPEKAMQMINQWSHAPANYLHGANISGSWLPGINLAMMRRSPAGSLHRDLLNCRNYENGLNAATQLRCPCLLVIAEKDQMTPARASLALQAALEKAGNSALIAPIAGAGHAMLSERADSVLDTLRKFL